MPQTATARAATARAGLISLEQALHAERDEVIRQHERHLNPRMMKVYEFIGLDNIPVRASGPYFWDADGRQYIDFLSAFATLAFGHNPPRLLAALRRVHEIDFPNMAEGPSPLAGALAENLATLAPGNLNRVFFANSGTETVDAAIKFARAATGRPVIVACKGGYHGRSIGALSVTDRPDYRENFEPLLPHIQFIPFGDADALRTALSARTAAGFIFEPIQGESGMVVPPPDYLRQVRKICTEFGTVMIADEIQTGLGRTGRMFAMDHDGVAPDCLLLGKALGGGVAALSALVTSDDLWYASKGDAPQSPFHISTYAGNSAACAVGIVSLEMLSEPGFLEQAAASGDYLMARLKDLQSRQPLIAGIRGRGLMLGIELAPPGILRSLGKLQNSDARYLLSGMVLRQLIADFGIVTAITLHNADVLRVQPPLNVERETIDRFVDALEATLAYVRNFSKSFLKSVPDIMRFMRSKPVATSYE